MNKIIIVIIISICICGCAWTVDLPRAFWGSSVRVLSDYRSEAETQSFSCSRAECFDAVLAMTGPYDSAEMDEEGLILFAKDPKKRYMVVMSVPEAVNTTEVGIFFDETSNGVTQVDISSLSSRAKATVAGMVFPVLEETCKPVL